MKITKQVLIETGAKPVPTPRTFSTKHARGDIEMKPDDTLLVAIVHTPFGEHFKEVYAASALQEIRSTPFASEFFVLSFDQVNKMKDQMNKVQ